MGVVSLRLSDDQERRLKQAGIVPAQAAKAHLVGVLRDLEIDEDLAFFDGVRQPTDIPTAELVRHDRESH